MQVDLEPQEIEQLIEALDTLKTKFEYWVACVVVYAHNNNNFEYDLFPAPGGIAIFNDEHNSNSYVIGLLIVAGYDLEFLGLDSVF